MTRDRRLFFKLNLAQRLLLKHLDQVMIQRAGAPTPQVTALFYLRKNEGCMLKDLSEALHQNKSAITTLVERLEKNELVFRKASDVDGRASYLFLTEKGKAACDEAIRVVKEHNSIMASQFNEEEMEVVHNFLDKLIALYKKG